MSTTVPLLRPAVTEESQTYSPPDTPTITESAPTASRKPMWEVLVTINLPRGWLMDIVSRLPSNGEIETNEYPPSASGIIFINCGSITSCGKSPLTFRVHPQTLAANAVAKKIYS